MDVLSITLVFFALVIAVSISYFVYFYKSGKIKGKYFLFFLRAVTIFSLLLLLINPQFKNTSLETVKPNLFIAVDNSSSIVFRNNDSVASVLANTIKGHKDLNDRFNTRFFTFGSELKNSLDLDFSDTKTNIFESINELNELANHQNHPIVIITDGNQTLGNDYRYYQSEQEIYPILLGDTLKHADIEIGQINFNSYSFLNNNFPVEIFLNYTGDKDISSKLTIQKENKVLHTQRVNFSSSNKSAHLQLQLKADTIGRQFYTVRIGSFTEEKNTINNSKKFSVEIIDEQTRIAVVHDIIHPDLGMLKNSVESNKQRKVDLLNVNEPVDLEKIYDAYVLYQPTQKFAEIIKHLKSENLNYFLVCGKSTDWNFVNNSLTVFNKSNRNQTSVYRAVYNEDYNVFLTEDLGFTDFSPLEGYYGSVNISTQHNIILKQSINGIETDYPLLGTLETSGQKIAFLFGENLWKWRSSVYQRDKSHEKFDHFLNSIVQYLTITKPSDDIELDYNDIYYSDENVQIMANVYDANFNFDKNASLYVQLENSTERTPFFSRDNYFQVNLGQLESGNYNFKVVNSVNNAVKKGSFSITDYSIEEEATSSNKKDLEELARNSNGALIYENELSKLTNILLNRTSFRAVQKEIVKTISLIEWKWLLGIIVVSLSLEWFFRKYRGLV